MNKFEILENRQRFVVALRSGYYKQYVGALCCQDMFCVWGVACEVFKDDVGLTTEEYYLDDNIYTQYVNINGIEFDFEPPRKILDLLGINYEDMDDLMEKNDEYGWNFNELADLIEENYVVPLEKELEHECVLV